MLSERQKDISTRFVSSLEHQSPRETTTVLDELVAGTLPPERMGTTLITIAETVITNPNEGWEILEYLQFCGHDTSRECNHLNEVVSALEKLMQAPDRPRFPSLEQLNSQDVQRILPLADVAGRLQTARNPLRKLHRKKSPLLQRKRSFPLL